MVFFVFLSLLHSTPNIDQLVFLCFSAFFILHIHHSHCNRINKMGDISIRQTGFFIKTSREKNLFLLKKRTKDKKLRLLLLHCIYILTANWIIIESLMKRSNITINYISIFKLFFTIDIYRNKNRNLKELLRHL